MKNWTVGVAPAAPGAGSPATWLQSATPMDHHIAELEGADSWFAGGQTFELDPTLTVPRDRDPLDEPRSTMRASRPRDAKQWPVHCGVAEDGAALVWTYTAQSRGT